LNERRTELLDNPRLVTQFLGLEQRFSRGTGQQSIDHAPGQHDDLSNAVAGALVLSEISRSMQAWRGMI
jgi:hypothetical protein